VEIGKEPKTPNPQRKKKVYQHLSEKERPGQNTRLNKEPLIKKGQKKEQKKGRVLIRRMRK